VAACLEFGRAVREAGFGFAILGCRPTVRIGEPHTINIEPTNGQASGGEQVSSVAKRVKLAECLAFLRDGDVLTVTKPDRLARSTAELLTIEADLTKRGIGLARLSQLDHGFGNFAPVRCR
jgi:hypothetical protein